MVCDSLLEEIFENPREPREVKERKHNSEKGNRNETKKEVKVEMIGR